MAKKLTKARYARLEALLAEIDPTTQGLSEVLAGGPGILVASAARLAIQHTMRELVGDLEAAYERLEDAEMKSAIDPGCRGKAAIVEALRSLDARSAGVFLHAAEYRQLEPAWGGATDTAVALRAAGVAGLVEMNHSHALVAAATLLADSESVARVGAAQALASLDGDAPAAVLRLKALVGDSEPEVLQACLASLLVVTPDNALDFVCRWLAAPGEADCEAAAFALADAREPQALARLIEWHRSKPENGREQIALTAIALSRLQGAFDYLFDALAREPLEVARGVIEALSVYAPDAALRERAATVLARRGDRQLAALAEEKL